MFAEKRWDYKTTVPNKQKTLRLQVNIADPAAKISIGGKRLTSGEVSKPIKLKKKGKTKITIVVTAQDGSEKIYTVIVTKKDPG